MSEQLDIVCCLDNNFAQHCGVVMASVLENTEHTVHFHIITDGLSTLNKKRLEELVNRYKSSVSFYNIDKERLQSCLIHENSHISLATYFRILLPDLLPDLNKVIYLDCDLVVRHDLIDLWNIDISNCAIGAAIDGTSCDVRHYNRLHYDQSLKYINAGVMLVNLKYWRDKHVMNRLLDYIEKYPERLLWMDQDAINGTLITETQLIPIKYNMQDQFFHNNPMHRQETLDEIEKTIIDPVIIHYTTANKAWHKYSKHPYTNEYYKYLKLTPWKNYRPKFRKSMSQKDKLKETIRYFLLGRKSNKYRTID